MTMDVYAHVAPEIDEKAAGAVLAATASVSNPLATGEKAELDEKTKTAQSLARKVLRWWAREVSNL